VPGSEAGLLLATAGAFARCSMRAHGLPLRPLTRDELQDLIDYADDRVDHAYRHGRIGWISAFRVATWLARPACRDGIVVRGHAILM
jgi:hypothetical protein